MDGDFPELSQIELSTIERAVGDAFYRWLDESDGIPMANSIEAAVKQAMTEWLDEHKDDIIEATVSNVHRIRR